MADPTPPVVIQEQLLELAQRCEAATGPDPDIDDAIKMALPPRYANGIELWPRYTRSLDAAKTLIENIGCVAWTVNACPYGSAIAEVYLGNPGPMVGTEAATPALALCAAALKARGSISDVDDGR